MLQSTGSLRVGHDSVTEQQQKECSESCHTESCFSISKEYKLEPKEETHRAQYGRVPNAKLPPSSGCVTLQTLKCDSNQKVLPTTAHLSFGAQNFFAASLQRFD